MKRLIKRFMTIFILVFIACFFQIKAQAAELDYGSEEISSQVDDMLDEYDISFKWSDMQGLSAGEMLSEIIEAVKARISAPVGLLGTIFVIIIFSALIKNFCENSQKRSSSANLCAMICILSAVAVISTPLLTVYESASESISAGGGFMLAFVPVFAGITMASGCITSAGVYNMIILGAAELMIQAADKLIMPLLSMTAALAVTAGIFANSTVDSLIKLIKKIITWTMTVAAGLFTGFISLKSTLGNVAEGFASKTAKFMISGFVPVIGSAVSDAYSTVKGSFDIMRCTAGTAGTVAIILIMLPPVLEIIVFRFVMWLGTAAAEMFSDAPLAKLLKNFDSGLAIALSILVGFGLLFVISTAILMKSYVS